MEEIKAIWNTIGGVLGCIFLALFCISTAWWMRVRNRSKYRMSLLPKTNGGIPRPKPWPSAPPPPKREVLVGKNPLTASEALYGFAGWLTTRKERTILSSKDDAAPIAELVAEFCKTNGLPDPREGWQNDLVHPTENKAAG